MRNRGFIFVVEMITTAIIIFIIFNFFFPPISFQHNWDKALLNLLSRDILISIERNKELYKYSFDLKGLEETLYQRKIIPSSVVEWAERENAIKKKIIIACKCSNDVINELGTFLNTITLNEREIKFEIVYSDLTSIKNSDVLLIWGYNDLSDSRIFNSLKNYLEEGKGIIEISDITNVDETHKKIFGLIPAQGSIANIQYLELSRNPQNSRDIIYEAWKYLHLKFVSPYQFSNSFNYNNILAKNEANVFLKFRNNLGETVPAAILNNEYGKTAWVANLAKDGLLEDGEKWVLTSLILWASNKHEKSGTKLPSGYENSYINVYKEDFFEVYAFTLGLGYP